MNRKNEKKKKMKKKQDNGEMRMTCYKFPHKFSVRLSQHPKNGIIFHSNLSQPLEPLFLRIMGFCCLLFHIQLKSTTMTTATTAAIILLYCCQLHIQKMYLCIYAHSWPALRCSISLLYASCFCISFSRAHILIW